MIVYHHPDAFLHDTGLAHPERPGRLVPLVRGLEDGAREGKWDLRQPGEASPEDLALLHDRGYIEEVRTAAGQGLAHLHTLDCPVSPGTWRAALLAAGAAVQGTEAVMAERTSCALSILRPPGHHARRGRAMGFCYFNNAALAAQALVVRHGLERVVVLTGTPTTGTASRSFSTPPTASFTPPSTAIPRDHLAGDREPARPGRRGRGGLYPQRSHRTRNGRRGVSAPVRGFRPARVGRVSAAVPYRFLRFDDDSARIPSCRR